LISVLRFTGIASVT